MSNTRLNREKVTSHSLIADYELTSALFVYRASTILSTLPACFFLPYMLYFLLESKQEESMATVHYRVRGVKCGRCAKIHTWYKYRVWRDGKKVKEEYVGKCDQFGNTAAHSWEETFHKQQEKTSWKDDFKKWQQTHQAHPRPKRTPYEVLGISYTATLADIKQAYKTLVKQYHPDLNRHVDPRIIVEINIAYQTLVK